MSGKISVLGVEIDDVNRDEAVNKVEAWVEGGNKCRMVATVYSEFLVQATKDKEFKDLLNRADMAVPDGQGVLAAMRLAEMKGDKFINGLRVGVRGFGGKNGEVVSGVWLFENLVTRAAGKGWRVFLLGGFGNTAERLSQQLKRQHRGIEIEFDSGAQEAASDIEVDSLIQKINKFKPELLFVAYGPVKQEKWIGRYKDKLKAKVAVGVGGTFDEVVGDFPRAPQWMERHGLKALWRLWVQPKRFGRIWRALIIFPWLVYKKSH